MKIRTGYRMVFCPFIKYRKEEMYLKNLSLKKNMLLTAFAGVVLFTVLNFDRVIAVFASIFSMCTPFFVGIVLAFILNMIMVPTRNFLEKKILKKETKWTKGVSILISYLVLIAAIVALLAFVIPELVNSLTTFVGNLSSYFSHLEEVVTEFAVEYNITEVDFEAFFDQFNDLIKNLANNILAYIGNMVPQIISLMSNIVDFLYNGIMAIVISANILGYKEKLFKQASRAVKALIPKWHGYLCELAHVSADTFRKYATGQFAEALILGMLCYIGMVIFRFDYALLISTVIAVTALIPVAGAYIGGAVAVILLAIISPVKAALFLVFLVLLQQFETNLIYPKVVGSSLELPGIWVILAVTLGGGMFGVIGILFAVPVMSIFYKQLRKLVEKKEDEGNVKKAVFTESITQVSEAIEVEEKAEAKAEEVKSMPEQKQQNQKKQGSGRRRRH